MRITKLPKALSQALRKYKPLRKDINHFKTALLACLNNIAIAEDNKESEENIKQYISEFFKNTFYQDHHINTKHRIDLAIYSGKDANSPVSILIESKNPNNSNEFLSENNINKKALHELLLYYLRERVDKKNNNIKHLIATNGYEWYLFKGEDFYNHFYKNTALQKEYKAFRDGEKDSSKNELFYKEIAAPFIEQLGDALDYVYFNVQDYSPYLDLENKKDNKLVSLYKTLSATHLLNKAFGNDSNQLNKGFYEELLHLIGLEEVKEKGKKVIQRLPKEKREYGSLLEAAIFTLEDRDYLHKVPNLRSYGSTKEDQLFSVGLELCLTWINRVLFIKLLESQLLDYHDGDKNYRFLHQDFIKGFDDLEALFFSALAKKKSERSERYQDKYQYIPYLNSSLFEPNELESKVMQLSNIKDENIQLYSKTVLKDGNNKRLTGHKDTLSYLFEFLEAYDFSSDNKNQIEEGEQSKALINASVLGLIFEKINGYKDGSFYTPAYITMYMSRETLRRAVVQKMNTHYQWSCSDFEDLKEDLRDHIKEQGKERKAARLEANKVINSLKICDPAVGSGHFLVSCLNELIAIKSDLKILCDAQGERLDTYVSLENDELILEDENGDFFTYNPSVERTHSTQKALFHEKQTLIENCLFAVDINPNSVKICRLRLWIELLKNAYYNQDNVLQTLPNIDINIKCGNSLISRFELDDDLKAAFKNTPYTLKDYKNAVKEYKTTNDKNRKREIQTIIDTIKSNFKTFLSTKQVDKHNRVIYKYNIKKEELDNLTKFGAKVTSKDKAALKKLKTDATKAIAAKEEITTNAIYQNAFEWRFEFPEILDDKGEFVGFDVVIGNPPYIRHEEIKELKPYLKTNYSTFAGTADLLTYFVELGQKVLNKDSFFSFIISNKFTKASYGNALREFLQLNTALTEFIDFNSINVFAEATVDACILSFQNNVISTNKFTYMDVAPDFDTTSLKKYLTTNSIPYQQSILGNDRWLFESSEILTIKDKMKAVGTPLIDWDLQINFGIKTGLNEAFIIDGSKKDELINIDEKNSGLIKPIFRGRDVQKYNCLHQDNWLVYIPWHFPFDNDETIKGYSKDAENAFQLNYPTLYNYLTSHKEKLSNRNKAETNIRYEWYALQRYAANYRNAFKKPKIVWKRIGSILRFSYVEQEIYGLDSTCIATGSHLKYLVALLNSKLCNFELFNSAPRTGTGDLIISVQALTPLYVPIPTPQQEQPFIERVNQILTQKQQDPAADTSQLEQEIDVLVYQLYNLTYEEVKIVDKDFLLSKAAYEKGAIE